MNRDWFWGLILVAAIVLAYQPVWYAGYIWDDDYHLTNNPRIVGPLGLREIWTFSAGNFYPLVLTTFWIEHALWGLQPLPFHLVNVMLHVACAILLWRVLRELAVPGAWLGAALWALHPVQVESVAWISETKNTQSCLFYLFTILFFVRWLKARPSSRPGEWNYALALLCAALAMASKSSTVVLPAVLLLIAWWVEGTWQWRNLIRVAPIFLLSLLSIAVTMWPQTPRATMFTDLWKPTGPERLAIAGDAIWFYLGKLIWPVPLSAIYPRWKIDGGQFLSYVPLLLALSALLFLWSKRKTAFRPLFFALAYFLVVISPFLGLIDQTFWHYSFVEDHLQYLACMGPLALAGAALAIGVQRLIPDKMPLQFSIGAGLLLVLGLLSWQRAWVFQNPLTLWTDVVARNPDCAVAHYNLGVPLADAGRLDEAMTQFQKTIELNPSFATAHYDLGNAFYHQGRPDQAILEYRKAIALEPQYAQAHQNLALALVQNDQLDEGIAHFRAALEINPDYTAAHYDLGIALAQEKHWNEAAMQMEDVLRISPGNRNAQHNLIQYQSIAQQALDTR